MARTVITPDKNAVVSEIEIAAPPQRVFQALIDRQQAMHGARMMASRSCVGKWRPPAANGGLSPRLEKDQRPATISTITEKSRKSIPRASWPILGLRTGTTNHCTRRWLVGS
jgi:hypothetical protein